mgnify:CR=1 FL=1
MTTARALAPGIPADYYDRIFEHEERHWWYLGLRRVSAALLGDRLRRPGSRVLDAGCGTGGFLRWLLDHGSFASAAGIDVGSAAIELARARVPEADLRVAAMHDLPFADAAFDLVVTNDVLQHVHEDDVGASLLELRRVLAPAGTLLVRTNGARRLRRERDDWRAYDRRTLVETLAAAGLECERVTYVNCALSVYGLLRGRVPHAPTESGDGIPTREPGRLASAVGGALLRAEARWLARPGRTLPYGHTLLAVATPRR